MPRCPGCFVPMTRLEEDAIHSCVCQQCFGRWIGNIPMLRRVRLDVEQARAADTAAPTPLMQESLEDLVAIVAESSTKSSLRCPLCEKPMAKDRFHQMIPIKIDRCKHCQSIWLDTGKYTLLRRLYVEMVTSTDPRVVALREKFAGARLEWDARERALSDARDSLNSTGNDHAVDQLAIAELSRILRTPAGP